MKYIFIVNSNITGLSAEAVILHEKIPTEDIVILTMRGAKVLNKNYKHVDFIYPHVVNPIPQTRNLFKCWRVLNEFDNFVSEITSNEQFYCFVNHNMARNTELLINHSNCRGFSILEEGAAAYNTKEYFDQKHLNNKPSLWDIIGYKNRIKNKYYYRPDYDKAYAVTQKSFPGFKNVVLLENVFKLNKSYLVEYNNSIIIVFDAVITFGMIELNSFIKGFKIFLNKEFSKFKGIILYKFHPAQLAEEKKCINECFLSYENIRFVELPNDLVLEELVATADNLTMYFNVSTVSIYARAFGHKCYSFLHILEGECEFYKNKVKDLNSVLRSSCKPV